MKKLVVLVLAVAMILSMFAVSASAETDLKIGLIMVGDETEGYTLAHMEGIKAAAAALEIPEENLIWKTMVEETSDCYEDALDLYAQGCRLIIANSYGHQTYIAQAAEELPDATFVAMTGDFAAVSGIPNLKNAFTRAYQSRYVSGVVAGLKLQQLLDDGILTPETKPDGYDADGNIKIGYVGAFPYPEVVSGYTAFFLGLRSVVPNVVMEVNYTNDWCSISKEAAAAEALVANGCVIIGQHADSTGAPSAIQARVKEGVIVYSVGYNIDMIPSAPDAALTSAGNNWVKYYTYAFDAFLKGEEIMVDWSEGYENDAVLTTPLNENTVAPGTAEYVADIIAKLQDGTIEVFDTDTFTVGGEKVESAPVDLTYYDWSTGSPVVIYAGETVEAIIDGVFEESLFRSAPYFALRIDGIIEK